jgi:hypothetical protein
MTAPKPVTPTPTGPVKMKMDKARKARKPVPEGESKEARFTRIAKSRLSRVVAQLRRLETVGRSPAYNYSPDQANKLMDYLNDAVDRVRMAFVARVNNRPEDSISL